MSLIAPPTRHGMLAVRPILPSTNGDHSHLPRVPVGIIGTGTVGRALLGQLAACHVAPTATRRANPWVYGIANSRSMRLGPEVLHGCDWETGDLGGEPVDLDEFAARLKRGSGPGAAPVIVDLTASPHVAARHLRWLSGGLHVVTANKLGVAGTQREHQDLQAAAGRFRYAYETTVGAALPVVQTIRDLRETGDRILQIQGMLSGTLSYLFNEFDGSRRFSELVWEARGHGLTEPDPRTDLTGIDVARKLVILAREAGLTLEVDDIQLESLVPAELAAADPCSMPDCLRQLDEPMQRRLQAARQSHGVLRYAARLQGDGKARVGLDIYPLEHSFADTGYAENLIEITTQRYRTTPLIIRGPGAGAELTAAGVFADLLKVMDFELSSRSAGNP